MKTKEEVIRDAWNNVDGENTEIWANYWNYDKAKKQGVDDEGFIKVIGYEPDCGETIDYMRPPQLQGIKNNNGWIKIESEEDLPKDDCNCFVYDYFYKEIRIDEYRSINKYFLKSICSRYSNITHYKPIIKPKPPIY